MSSTSPADLDAAVKRVRELSEQALEQAKQNGLTWLNAYEKVLQSMLDLEQNAAKGSGIDIINTLATTHANFVRETSQVILDAARDQLK